MSFIRHLLVLIAAGFVTVSANAARPAPCVAGSVASIQGTSCTINDLIFTFGQTHVVDQFGNQTIDSLKFVPLARSSGFAVTGKWTNTFANSELWITGFGVATLDGAATISGITVKDFAKGDIHFAELTMIDASDPNNTVLVSTGYSYPVGCLNPYSCSSSFSKGPVAAAYDPYYAILEGTIPGNSTVTSYASEFLINRTPAIAAATVSAVPEPAGVVMMLAGLLVLGTAASRRSFRGRQAGRRNCARDAFPSSATCGQTAKQHKEHPQE